MSSNVLSDAFNYGIGLNSRSVTLYRAGETDIIVKVCTSNYFRNLAMPEEVVTEGKEYLISKLVVTGTVFDPPKRGDKIEDVELGTSTISEVRPLVAFGEVIGYRLRLE